MAESEPMLVWDSDDFRDVRNRKMFEWIGNWDAVNCIVALSTVAEAWDDWHDKDKPADIDAAMTILLVGLPQNAWWYENQRWFLPIVVMSVNAWLDSRTLEISENRTHRAEAFVLRNLAIELVQSAVFFCHGWEAMRACSLEVREFFRHETFDDWEGSL